MSLNKEKTLILRHIYWKSLFLNPSASYSLECKQKLIWIRRMWVLFEKCCTVRNLRQSLQRWWRVCHSTMWRHVNWYTGTSISEDHAASICRLIQGKHVTLSHYSNCLSRPFLTQSTQLFPRYLLLDYVAFGDSKLLRNMATCVLIYM